MLCPPCSPDLFSLLANYRAAASGIPSQLSVLAFDLKKRENFKVPQLKKNEVRDEVFIRPIIFLSGEK